MLDPKRMVFQDPAIDLLFNGLQFLLAQSLVVSEIEAQVVWSNQRSSLAGMVPDDLV